MNIIAIDGGGVRGLTPILVLKELHAMTGDLSPENSKRILFAGTSTGGIISSYLATFGLSKQSLHILETMYTCESPDIFKKKTRLTAITSLLTPMYSPKHLQDILRDVYTVNDQELRLSHTKFNLLATAYDIDNGKVKIFKDRQAKESKLNDIELWKVSAATSAAPTYFPPLRSGEELLVDGGVYINNPTMAAVSEVIKHSSFYETDQSLSNLNVLSLGTGDYVHKIGKRAIWGKIQWVTQIIQIMMQGQVQASVYDCEQLLKNYVRINPWLDMAISLDDTSDKAIESMRRSHRAQQVVIRKRLEPFVEKMLK